jgi:hypothetical protein
VAVSASRNLRSGNGAVFDILKTFRNGMRFVPGGMLVLFVVLVYLGESVTLCCVAPDRCLALVTVVTLPLCKAYESGSRTSAFSVATSLQRLRLELLVAVQR